MEGGEVLEMITNILCFDMCSIVQDEQAQCLVRGVVCIAVERVDVIKNRGCCGIIVVCICCLPSCSISHLAVFRNLNVQMSEVCQVL